MYCGREQRPTDEGEQEIMSFDFKKDLADGETITSTFWECTVAVDSTGSDPSPQDHVFGDAVITGPTVTSQPFTGFLPGVKYVLQAWIMTSDGQKLSLWTHIVCGVPA
jgi:hypothetical protein